MVELYDISQLNDSIQKLIESRDLDSVREMYLECIMDWSDHYSENYLSETTDEEGSINSEKNKALENISKAWISYASFEVSEKQYKKAAVIYEKAMEDSIAKSLPDLYVSYSLFCEDRGKLGNAKNILIKGVTSQLESNSCDKLWIALLSLMRRSGGPSSHNLTYQVLYDAVKLEKLNENTVIVTSPSEDLLLMNECSETTQVVESKENELIINDQSISINIDNDNTPAAVVNAGMDIDTPLPTIFSTAEKNTLIIGTVEPTNVKPIILAKPQRSDTKNIDMSMNNMTPEQMNKMFTKRPYMIFNFSETSDGLAPKRFRLGNQEVIDIEKFLGAKLPTNTSELELSPLRCYLDIIEALWTYQALTERHFNSWYNQLNVIQMDEEKNIGNDPNKIRIYEDTCKVQMEVLNSYINYTMFNLLIEQENILSKLSFPRFSMNFVDQIKNAYDHSNVINTVQYQQQLINGLLMLRFDPSKDNFNPTNSSSSMNNNSNDILEPLNNFYSQEAKTKRRKRRMQDLNMSPRLNEK